MDWLLEAAKELKLCNCLTFTWSSLNLEDRLYFHKTLQVRSVFWTHWPLPEKNASIYLSIFFNSLLNCVDRFASFILDRPSPP